MKVCVFGTRGFPLVQGGVEKHCESLYPLFDSRYRFCVFRRKPYVRSSQTYPDIAFIDLPSTRIKGFEAFFHSFLATVYCLFLRPDVVHIHNIGPALFSPLLRLFGLKTVLTYHSPNYEHKKWGFFARHLLKLSERIAFRTADKVIFVNRFQMEKSLKQLGGKACYIPNGIPSVKPAFESSYISQLGLEPGKYVLSVGRITPEKGFDCLLKAYARIPRPGYKLVIAGGVEAESSYGDGLKALVKEKENVVFTGYVYGEKLNQLFTFAGLYVLSSYNEGFPMVLLEAMTYRLDVLVSDIPAAHLVSLNGDDYFAKGNDEELAAKMDLRMRGPRKRTYALESFDWRRIVSRVAGIYDSLAGNP